MTKKHPFLIAILSLLLFACGKNNDDPNNANCGPGGNNEDGAGDGIEEVFVIPSTVGTYWVYQWYQVTFDGEETMLSRIDSVYVSGDSLIGGELFTVHKGSFFFPEYQLISRDSSGYFIDQNRDVLFSYLNFTDTLDSGPQGDFLSWYTKMYDYQLVNVPAGTFLAIEARKFLYRPSGDPVNACGDQEVELGYFYSDGVGMVQAQTGYFGPIQACDYYEEARLIRYYIAP